LPVFLLPLPESAVVVLIVTPVRDADPLGKGIPEIHGARVSRFNDRVRIRFVLPGDVERLLRPGDIYREFVVELLEKGFLHENGLTMVEGVPQMVEV